MTTPARALPGYAGEWAPCSAAVQYVPESNLCPSCGSKLFRRPSNTTYAHCPIDNCNIVVDTSRNLVYTRVA